MRDVKSHFAILALCSVLPCLGLQGQRLGDPHQQWQEKYPTVIARLDAMTALPIGEWRSHNADLPHGEDPSLNDSDWPLTTLASPGHKEEELDTGADRRWYRTTFEIPSRVGGRDIQGAQLRLALSLSTDGRVFLNGGLVAQGDGSTLDPILITDKAVVGQKIQLSVEVPFHAQHGKLLGAKLIVDYPNQANPGLLRSEIQSAEAAISDFPNGRGERERQLNEAVRAIDFTALDQGDQVTFTHSLETANRDLQPLNEWMKQFTVRLVGNAHIDMAWLWPWTETVGVVRDTFATVLQLMREYPQFIYTQSSAQDFAWLEDKYPAEFKQIQDRVKEGRWELVGGMWVEPDLNMPDGESLVRQILIGKRYFRQKFGVDVHIGWNPDSFGYSWQLPQIYKKSGFDAFVTQKLSWNDTTVFPYKLFWWESPDGSKLLTYFPHGYNGRIDPVRLANDISAYVPITGFPQIMHLYGVGDHGGGPTRQMLDEAVRLKEPSVVFPKVEFSTAQDFFADLKKAISERELKPPVWKSELYLEYHRGCYTTQSETKKNIRSNEELLQNAEKFAALSFLTSKQSYSNIQFEEIWKRVLFNQFHDIMPGSGVGNNYVEAARSLNDARLESNKILDGALNNLAAHIDTRGVGVPVVVFNPLSWKRTEAITVEVHSPSPGQELKAVDPAGKPLLSQVISVDDTTQRTKLQVMVKDVPSLGYTVIHIVSVTHTEHVFSSLKVEGTTLENEFFRVKIDPKTGCITSLLNKQNNIETLAPGGCGNLLQTFVDRPPKQDAWEIKFDAKSWDLEHPQEVKIVESGPERAVLRIKNRFQNSTFVQELVVHPGVPRIDVHMQANWHEEHILLKVGFPVNVQATKATFEIPYGTIERPTTRNTPAEKAQFEVPALRWGDISDASQGLSLLNASKYGYDANANVIRLSLLRSPQMPAPDSRIADQGFHEFTYALYPHSGDWKTGETMRQGYELNYPLIPIGVQPHAGSWPTKRSFASVEPRNVIMTVVKKAEDNDSVIFQFYEFEGKSTQVALQLPETAVGAVETDLMEKAGKPIPLQHDGHQLIVPTGPYEIKTVEVTFAPGETPGRIGNRRFRPSAMEGIRTSQLTR